MAFLFNASLAALSASNIFIPNSLKKLQQLIFQNQCRQLDQ
jgi:hypothetical protein